MHCVGGADSCQSVFDTREVTFSSQCRGEDAGGVSQRRSVTWDCSCLDKDPWNLKLPQPGTRLGALQEPGAVCAKKTKKKEKRKKNQTRLMFH